jgi:hypothetical protein
VERLLQRSKRQLRPLHTDVLLKRRAPRQVLVRMADDQHSCDRRSGRTAAGNDPIRKRVELRSFLVRQV